MKKGMKILCLLSTCLLACSQNEAALDPAFNITLDSGNSYVAGEPVKFNVKGNIDNILFYSGEPGSEYVYRDRFEVSPEQIKSASLDLECQSRYGSGEGGLEIYVSNKFTGLKWDDAESDRALVREMVEGGMKDWIRLEYKEGASQEWTSHHYDVSEYLDNFALAFHWCPEQPGQRTFWVNGNLSVQMDGKEPETFTLQGLGADAVMMTPEVDAYHKNQGNGSIKFDSKNAEIAFQGGKDVAYAIDGWVFTTPMPLCKVANDKGIVIKNMQNYLRTYEYTWQTPGTYKVVFVGTELIDGNVEEQIRNFTMTIMPAPEKDEKLPEDSMPGEDVESDDDGEDGPENDGGNSDAETPGGNVSKDYDVFLLIGQSNMAGRGEMLEGDDKVFDDNVFILNDKGEPVPACNPLNQYSTIRKQDQEQKIGPGFGFSRKVSQATGRKILLVVNARGGSNIEQWDKDSEKYNYYDEAVRRARQAMEYGTLKGILWHQGCSDVSRRDIYMDWLKEFVSSLRADLGHVPFVAGELGQWRSYVLPFNEMLHTITENIPDSDWVSSDGGVPIVTATSNGEPDMKDAHFNRESQIILGERYADKILKMCYGK